MLGAGQSKLSHPHTDTKIPNRCQRRAGCTPRSTSRVCASPAGLLWKVSERRGALIEGFTRSRPKEVPARVVRRAEGRHQEQDEEDRVEEGNNRESTMTTLRRRNRLANDRAQRPGLKECCPPGGSGTSLSLARRSSPIRLTPSRSQPGYTPLWGPQRAKSQDFPRSPSLYGLSLSATRGVRERGAGRAQLESQWRTLRHPRFLKPALASCTPFSSPRASRVVRQARPPGQL